MTFTQVSTKNLMTAAILLLGPVYASFAQTPGREQGDEGKRVYNRANCVGCHKWHGNGGGGYGGAALSLRKTDLTVEQIIETVRCGRPGTGMPYHFRGAYDTVRCYDMVRQDVPDRMPPEPTNFLRQPEIEAVAKYVVGNLKGRGEPGLEDCTAYFGDGSKACDIYKRPDN